MSEYVYESGMSTHRRKQRRTAITLMLTLLIIFGAFWWAWSYIRADDSSTATPTADNGTPGTVECAEWDPRLVTVNVYNASNRRGLAGLVAGELESRGFEVGQIANDPLRATLEAPVQIRYGEPGRQQASVLRDLVEDEHVVRDDRTDTTLDLVLGESFGELNPEPAGIPPGC